MSEPPGHRFDDPDIRPSGGAMPLFKDGEVLDVRVVGASVAHRYGVCIVELACEVLDDLGQRRMTEHGEIVALPLYCRLPMTPDGKPRPNRRSKFYRLWVLANGGRAPGRRDRMSLRIFKDRLFRGRVHNVTTNDKREPLPDPYSTIEEFLP